MRGERGRLSPKDGYVVRVSQLTGGRPTVWVECLSCVSGHSVTFAELDVTKPEPVGRAILSAVSWWLMHKARDHDAQPELKP